MQKYLYLRQLIQSVTALQTSCCITEVWQKVELTTFYRGVDFREADLRIRATIADSRRGTNLIYSLQHQIKVTMHALRSGTSINRNVHNVCTHWYHGMPQ